MCNFDSRINSQNKNIIGNNHQPHHANVDQKILAL